MANASAISHESSTLGGVADKYRQAYLIDKPAARKEKLREREIQLEKELKKSKLRNKNLEDVYMHVKKDLEDSKLNGKKREGEVKDLKSALSEVNRQVFELNEKNEDL